MKLIFFLCFNLFAFEKVFFSKDFDKANQSGHFIRFDMESTKAGLITTSFFGLVKSFKVSGKHEGNIIRNGRIEFFVNSMDTDINARNEKMHDYCLDAKNYPKIEVALPPSISLGKNQNSSIILKIKGRPHKLPITLTLIKKGDNLFATGTLNTSLKNLEIPDPSIWIASVSDQVSLSFKFEIPL